MKHYQFWGTIVKISCVPLSFLLLKYHPNPNLALVVVMVCRLFGHIVGLFIVRTLVDLSLKDYLLRVVVPIFAIFVLSFPLSYLTHIFMEEGFIRLVCVAIMSVFSVLSTLYFIALDNGEKRLVLNLANALIVKFKH